MKNFILFFVCILSLNSRAQSGCGTPWDDQWAIDMARADRSYLTAPRGLRAITYVPIHYHIVRDNAGANGFPINYLVQMHCELNKRYAPADIQFYMDSISYINSSNLFDYASNTLGGDNAVFLTYNTPKICNVYLVKNPAGNCGYTYRPGIASNYGGIFVAAAKTSTTCSAPGATTLTHEMGHWLDLPHTFFGWEGIAPPSPSTNAPTKPPGSFNNTERVSRTTNANCASSGDFFCGTPPDYISNRWTCPSGPGTTYKDPTGTTFVHDGSYYMGYANDNCQNKFSSDQMAQMRNALNTKVDRKDILAIPVPPMVDYEVAQNLAPEDLIKLPRNKVQVSWKPVPEATKYHLMVLKGNSALNNNPNFDLFNNLIVDTIISDTILKINYNFPTVISQTNIYYYWKVKPISKMNTCDSYTVSKNFKVGSFNVDMNITPIKCNGEANGTAQFTVTGGTATSYTYDVTPIGPSNDLVENIAPGFYVMNITGDNPSDFVQIPFEIVEPKAIEPNFVIQNTSVSSSPTGGTAPYTFKWSTGATTSSIAVENKKSYTLTITDNKGCVITKSIAIGNLSIVQLDQKQFNIYPNPIENNHPIAVEFYSDQQGKGQLEIFDIKGNSIKSLAFDFVLGNNSMLCEIPTLENGVYFMQLKSNSFEGTRRFIVSKPQ